MTQNHHRTPAALLLLVALGSPWLALAQPMKPALSIDIQLNAYKLPPFPVEVVHVGAAPGGGLAVTSYMPIAGRPVGPSETPTTKGALFPSNAAYLCTQTFEASGKLASQQGAVFCAQKPEAPNPDFAVFGTIPTDGPQRLPFGGDLGQLPVRFPQAGLPETYPSIPRIVNGGKSFSYANSRLLAEYIYLHTEIDPNTGRIVRREDIARPQAEANQQKMAGYVAATKTGLPIGEGRKQFESIAFAFDEKDKNVQYRQFHILRFDNAGTLLRDQPIDFPVNRQLYISLPLHDTEGRVVGTFSMFGAGSGKKADLDPQENRRVVVITDEQGNTWAQFDWNVNGSSSRAAFPFYVQRTGERVAVFSLNQQKLLKPVHESWLFTRTADSVQVAFAGSITDTDVKNRSTPLGMVNGGVDLGYSVYTEGVYTDSFTDETGNTWVLRQRHSRSAGSSIDSPEYWGDVFVQQFDGQMQLKQQTVIALPAANEAITWQRVLRYADGAAYVLTTPKGNQIVLLRGKATTPVNRHILTPNDCALPIARETPNFVADQDSKRLWVVYRVAQRPHEGRLVAFDLK